MKEKLIVNTNLLRKESEFRTKSCVVEKAIAVSNAEFENLKRHPLRDNKLIAENVDIMYCDNDDNYHCLLIYDEEHGDGLLIESEGSIFARYAQYVPNARALLENQELTAAERKIHEELKKISENIAEIAHYGEKNFVFEDLLEKSEIDFKSLLRDAVTAMLRDREDIQTAESQSVDVDFQPDISIELKPVQELKFYSLIQIKCEEGREITEPEKISCMDEINEFIGYFEELGEKPRGLMEYFSGTQSVSEKVFSASPSVEAVDGTLMGVLTCQVIDELTDSELEELRKYVAEQYNDCWGRNLEQHGIVTEEYGGICVSFRQSDDCFLQTAEEMGLGQSEMNMTM